MVDDDEEICLFSILHKLPVQMGLLYPSTFLSPNGVVYIITTITKQFCINIPS